MHARCAGNEVLSAEERRRGMDIRIEETETQEELSLEELFEQLEDVIHKMEEEEVSLEDSFGLYHKGMELLKNCSGRIDAVEKKMLILDEEGGTHEF
jgi:exodeoxyribonuclease VII small subunit